MWGVMGVSACVAAEWGRWRCRHRAGLARHGGGPLLPPSPAPKTPPFTLQFTLPRLFDAQERVPLLVDGQTLLTDATIITEYLDRQYAGSGTPLLPDSPAAQARIKLFIQVGWLKGRAG